MSKQTASTGDNKAASYLHDTSCLNASAREILGHKWRNTGSQVECSKDLNGHIFCLIHPPKFPSLPFLTKLFP